MKPKTQRVFENASKTCKVTLDKNLQVCEIEPRKIITSEGHEFDLYSHFKGHPRNAVEDIFYAVENV